jgi:peptide/nickel transport system substrate-binding protein
LTRQIAGLQSRVSRRKVIGVAAMTGAALGAAAVIGCGGGSGSNGASGGSSAGPSSLIYKPQNTTAQAKPGGTYKSFTSSDVSGFDYLGATGNRDRTEGNFVYSRLFKWKPGILEPARGEIDGDLVDTWEIAPDNLSITMKLKAAAKWDPRPPTNSRPLDSEDVKFSLDRLHQVSLYRNDWFEDLGKGGPISGVETPDASTVKLKLAFPLAALFDYLGNTLGLFVMPKESDGKFDPKKDMRGTGAWLLDKYEPSVGMEYKRNPNWYLKDRPFLDGWSQPIIPEYAQQLAQFRAGNIWGGVVRQEDIIQTKKDLPQLLLIQGEYGPTAPGIFFGWASPFKDVRLRQAMSMLIDRETFARTFSNMDQFQSNGIDLALVYDNFLGRGWGDYWLDPTGKDAGPDAGNLKYNPSEAKKLLSAAGYPNGLSTTFYGPTGNPYGPDYTRAAQALAGMVNEGGIKVTFQEVGYSNDYVPNYNYNQYFDGISIFVNTTYGGVANNLRTNYHSNSVQDRSPFAPSKIGKPPAADRDTTLDGLIEKLLRERDRNKAVEDAHEIQRYLTKVLYTIPYSYKIRGLSLTWPWVGNAGVYQGYAVTSAPTDTLPFLWYDASKKPA